MGNFLVLNRTLSNGLAALLFILFLPIAFATANVPVADDTCPEPDVSVSSQTTGAISFTWDAVTNAVGYNVKYVRDGSYSSEVFNTTSTSISFTNLTAGTYDFYFQTDCGGSTSGWIITDDIIIL